PHPGRLERRRAATLVECRDPALPPAGPTPGSLAQLPGAIDPRRLGLGWRLVDAWEPAELRFGSRDRGIQRWRGDRLPLERLARRPNLVAQPIDQLLSLAPRCSDRLVALASRPTPLLVGRP